MDIDVQHAAAHSAPAPAGEQTRAAEARAFAEGFTVGYAAGYEIGQAHVERAMAEAWRWAHEVVQRHAKTPTFAELLERRGHGNTVKGVRRAATRCVR